MIKMDENSQYGFAMTKPLPYGCIKKKKNLPNLEELAVLLKNVTLQDELGHLFVVDIEFADINKKKLCFLMKFIHQYLKSIKRLIQMRDLVPR